MTDAASQSHQDPGERRASWERLVLAIENELAVDERSRVGRILLAIDDQAEPSREQGAYVQILLTTDGVGVCLCALSDPAAQAFLEWLRERTSIDRLQTLNSCKVVLVERRPSNYDARYSGQRPKWSAADQQLIVRKQRRASDIDEEFRDELVESIARLDQRWEKAGFRLETVPASATAGTTGAETAADLANEIRELLPILGPINLIVRRLKKSRPPALERAPWRGDG